MIKEEEARKRVKALRQFYMDLMTYAIVNVVLVLLWLAFNSNGAFWPKYVIVVWGTVLLFKAYRMNLMPFVLWRFSFLTPEWEAKKVKELIGRTHIQRKIQLMRDEKKKRA